MSAASRDAPQVALVGALDTKEEEYTFVRDRLALHRVGTVLVDTGVLGSPRTSPEHDRVSVAAAGGESLDSLVRTHDRAHAVEVMARGAARLVRQLVDRGNVQGVLVLGGSNAGFVMSQIAATLPIGVPKLLVSTIVAGDTRPYVGGSDLMMMYPIVDIAGLNSVSTPVLARAADALAGMVVAPPMPATNGAVHKVACSMFGVTTQCVTAVREALEAAGDEVTTFHATGTGGMSMEMMIRSGMFDAAVDMTTTELADHLCGGVCDAGPHRMEAAGAHGIPQVVSTGALDMVNFGGPETVPERYRHRLLYRHNPIVTLMRTNVDENAELGRVLARKVNRALGPVEVVVPRLGFSQISTAGGPFHDPVADEALIESLQSHLDPHVPLHVIEAAINDGAFSASVIDALGRVLSEKEGNKA